MAIPKKVAPIEADAGWPINLPGCMAAARRSSAPGRDRPCSCAALARPLGPAVQFYTSQYVLARAEASDGKKGPVPRTQ